MTATEKGGQAAGIRLARIVAEVFAPAVLVCAVTVAISLASSPGLRAGLLWALVSAGFCSGIPIWFLARGARAGRWDTHHVRDQKDRILPLIVALGSVLTGLLVMVVGGAPGVLVSLVTTMLICLTAATVVTKWWKISMHSAIAAGTVAITALTFGLWWWLGAFVVTLVGWSRVVTGDHTPAQAIGGAVLGTALGGGLYAVLR
ncbi:hypothetical protein HUO13_06710 [Saccharopolyspora erythraea]|uniref:hypothetical protein n=1 Tax=Saccharopolyspora erythraea TaxID=1836 RepID=UPI001BAE025A|nr:hypothetical protein [Saccharopolyspora erythraea]QUH00549.1 hypothetical protein HUO13_06710 [Saccharopolyspora erythraea]